MRRLALILSFIWCSAVVWADETPQGGDISSAIGSRAKKSCGPIRPDLETPYIALHSPGYPAVDATLEKLANSDNVNEGLKIGYMGDFMQMGVLDVALPASAFFCGYDMYDATQCKGLPFLPNPVESATLLGETLRFTTIQPESGQEMQFEFKNRALDRVMISTKNEGSSSITSWIRKPNGTEVFLSESSSGDVSSYTENPDCSGQGHTVRHNERGLLTTNDFSWTSVKQDAFVFRYKYCSYQEPNIGCEEGKI